MLTFDLDELKNLSDRELLQHIYEKIQEERIKQTYGPDFYHDALELLAMIQDFGAFYYNLPTDSLTVNNLITFFQNLCILFEETHDNEQFS